MNHPKMLYSYVGIDNHKDSHTAVVMNCFMEKTGEITFKNTPSAFDKFLSDIQKYKVEGTSFAFGLEDTSAYGRQLAIFLKQNNQLVKHVNAGLVAKERKNMNVVEKTDSIDAECAARVLLSKFGILSEPDTQDKYWILKGLVIRRRNIVKMNINLKNHLHSYLTGHYSSYTKFFAEIHGKGSLAFFNKYPSSSELKDVKVEDLDKFLSDISHVYKYSERAKTILSLVKEDGEMQTEHQEIRNLVVKSTIGQVESNMKELEHIDSLIENFIEHFDQQLKTITGIDTTTAAELLAEIGDIKKFPTAAKLARYAGISPVTYASGKKDFKYASKRGNRTLNSIFYNIAMKSVSIIGTVNKRLANSFFYHYYNKKLQEGKTKRQALKCVQRRLVTIIWGMLTYKTPYISPATEPYIEEPKDDKTKSKKSEKQ